MPYFDDNFGHWEGMSPDDPDFEENLQFYKQVQRESVWKNCVVCGRAVKLRPDYDKCDGCCTKIERGGDPDYCDPADYEPLPVSSGNNGAPEQQIDFDNEWEAEREIRDMEGGQL